MANFAATTKSDIALLLNIPVTVEAMELLGNRLTDIESIDGGAMVATIEQLISDIQSFRDSSINLQNAATAGLIKADDVEWSKSGKGSGIIAQYNALRQQLSQLLGIPVYGSKTKLSRSDAYSLTGHRGHLSDWWYLAW